MAAAPNFSMTRSNFMPMGHVLNTNDTSAAKLSFSRLPSEISQEIAKYLPDKDLASFGSVEKATYYAVIPPNAGHWRVRFREQFDMTEKPVMALAEDYQMRKRYFSTQVYFKLGHSTEEICCLQVIRQLINESSLHTLDSRSKNMDQVCRFMMKSNLLYEAFRWVRASDVPSKDIRHCVNPLMMTLQVLFFPFNLDLTACVKSAEFYPLALRQNVYRIKWSQDVVLAPAEKPLVDDFGGIDMGVMYHLTNFWRFHLVLNEEGALSYIWKELEPLSMADNNYRTCPPNTFSFDDDWKGAMFHPAGYRTRSFMSGFRGLDDVYTNGFYTGGNDMLNLHIDTILEGVSWPAKFEEVINGLPDNVEEECDPWWPNDLPDYVAKKCDRWWPILECQHQTRIAEKPTKKGHRACSKKEKTMKSGREVYEAPLSFRPAYGEATPKEKHVKKGYVKHAPFIGTLEETCGGEKLNVAGIIHPLPPQCGTYGWQRFSMISFLTPPTGTRKNGYLDAKPEHLSIYMCYEGVILPGTNAILGRYFRGEAYDDGTDDQFLDCGPFFFWNATCVAKEYDDDMPKATDATDTGADPVNITEEFPDEAVEDESTEDEQFEAEDEQLWLAALNVLHEDQTRYWDV